jgi:hypothetical protein
MTVAFRNSSVLAGVIGNTTVQVRAYSLITSLELARVPIVELTRLAF